MDLVWMWKHKNEIWKFVILGNWYNLFFVKDKGIDGFTFHWESFKFRFQNLKNSLFGPYSYSLTVYSGLFENKLHTLTFIKFFQSARSLKDSGSLRQRKKEINISFPLGFHLILYCEDLAVWVIQRFSLNYIYLLVFLYL